MRNAPSRSFTDTIADTLASVSNLGGRGSRGVARGLPLLERRAQAEFDSTVTASDAARLQSAKLDAVRLSLAPVPRSLFDSGERRRETGASHRPVDASDPFARRVPFARPRRQPGAQGRHPA